MKQPEQEISYKNMTLPPFFLIGTSFYTRYFLSFLLAGALPFAALVFTSYLEYSINKSGVSAWMNGNFSFLLFNILISFIRFFAVGALVGACAYLAGKLVCANVGDDIPTFHDALSAGWQNAFRVSLAFLFLWFILSVYVQLVVILCKMMWLLFSTVNLPAAIISILLICAWAMLPPAILIGKFVFAIYLIVFEKAPALLAISIASKLVSFKNVVWKWPVILLCGALILFSTFLPALTYLNSLIRIAAEPAYSPELLFKIQIAGAIITFIATPLAVSVASTFYFMNSPRYWDFSNAPLENINNNSSEIKND